MEFFFWKKIFQASFQAFIFIHTFMCTLSEFFYNFRLSSRKSQSQQKLAKKMTHFTIEFCWKNLIHFTLRTPTHLTLKTICSGDTAKNLCDFTKFPANMFLFCVRKNICTAPYLDAQELLSWSTLKTIVCIFLYISMRNFCSRDAIRFYVVEWGASMIFVRQLAIWVS